VCNEDPVHDEFGFLEVTCRQNIYSSWQICRILDHPVRAALPSNDPDSLNILPYVGLTFNFTSRMLSWNNLK
jgi:hypothetical protein